MSTQQELCLVHGFSKGEDEVQVRDVGLKIKLTFPTRF